MVRCRAMPEKCLYASYLRDSCMCLYLYVSGLRSDVGNARGMLICFRISVQCGAGPEECLYVYVMWLFYVYFLICLYVYRAFPDAGWGSMPDIFRCRARSMSARPDEGAGSTKCLYAIMWLCVLYVLVWGDSLSLLLTVFSFGFR